MESIDTALQKMAGHQDLRQRMQKIKEEVLADADVQQFLKHHPEVDDQTINQDLSKLFEFIQQTRQCHDCNCLADCVNMMPGHQPKLFLDSGHISLRYEPCPYKVEVRERKKRESLIQSLYMPRDILQADMQDLDLNEAGRSQAIEVADDYIQTFDRDKTSHGLYFYGAFGVGKTYLISAVANELAKKKNVQTLIVYTPDLFREMKSAIQDQTVNEKLDFIKQAPILILDDIGAETVSSWVRDDILGVILQYRMMERLPTLYTSNYDFTELEEHLAYTNKSGTERLKARRLMERIKHLCKAVQLNGDNRRSMDRF